MRTTCPNCGASGEVEPSPCRQSDTEATVSARRRLYRCRTFGSGLIVRRFFRAASMSFLGRIGPNWKRTSHESESPELGFFGTFGARRRRGVPWQKDAP